MPEAPPDAAAESPQAAENNSSLESIPTSHGLVGMELTEEVGELEVAGPENTAPEPMQQPTKPKSAYMFFVDTVRAEIVAELGCRSPCVVAQLAGERWKHLPADARAKFEDQATQLKAAYEEAKLAYLAQGGMLGKPPPKAKKSKIVRGRTVKMEQKMEVKVEEEEDDPEEAGVWNLAHCKNGKPYWWHPHRKESDGRPKIRWSDPKVAQCVKACELVEDILVSTGRGDKLKLAQDERAAAERSRSPRRAPGAQETPQKTPLPKAAQRFRITVGVPIIGISGVRFDDFEHFSVQRKIRDGRHALALYDAGVGGHVAWLSDAASKLLLPVLKNNPKLRIRGQCLPASMATQPENNRPDKVVALDISGPANLQAELHEICQNLGACCRPTQRAQ